MTSVWAPPRPRPSRSPTRARPPSRPRRSRPRTPESSPSSPARPAWPATPIAVAGIVRGAGGAHPPAPRARGQHDHRGQQDGAWDAPVASPTSPPRPSTASCRPTHHHRLRLGHGRQQLVGPVVHGDQLGRAAHHDRHALVSGGQASEFPLAGGTCAGATLQPAADCTVSVSFKPGGTGARSATHGRGRLGRRRRERGAVGHGRRPARDRRWRRRPRRWTSVS